MRSVLFLMAIVTLGVLPLAAQRGGMGGIGGRPMTPRRGGAELPSEYLLRGPYPPDSMAHKFGLDSTQTERYRAAWDSMMTASRPTRDSLHQALDGMHRARTEGYQHEGVRQSALLQHLGKELKKDEDHFDGVIRHILTKDQWGDFKDWRKRRRETEKELRRQEMIDGGIGRRGGGRHRGAGS